MLSNTVITENTKKLSHTRNTSYLNSRIGWENNLRNFMKIQTETELTCIVHLPNKLIVHRTVNEEIH